MHHPMIDLFTKHPHSVGETYTAHLRTAWSFASSMLLGALACAVHGLLPFLFERTASARIGKLHERMVLHRSAARREMSLTKPTAIE